MPGFPQAYLPCLCIQTPLFPPMSGSSFPQAYLLHLLPRLFPLPDLSFGFI